MATEVDRIFLYGTLRYPPLLTAVAGEPLPGQAAVLRDFTVHAAEGETFPLVKVARGQDAPGIIVTVSKEALARLDYYEMGFGFAPTTVEVEVKGKGGVTARREAALVYLPEPDRWQAAGEWSLDAWMASHGEVTTEAAKDFMSLMGHVPATRAGTAMPQIKLRAASRLRARRAPRPKDLGETPDVRNISITDSRTPYIDYFSVREDDLTFPLFRGGSSGEVRRAAFMGGDAVTVLPYDPVRDTVLIVRQFRFGAFARGDLQPWCAEPIAGRIDPGETPEETARREAQEESGLTLGKLYPVARYYPSPAAFSEFLYSYVAPADLSRIDGRVGGASEEAEDIQSRVIPFEDLMAMIGSGEADTAPLVLSALWLDANRAKLARSK